MQTGKEKITVKLYRKSSSKTVISSRSLTIKLLKGIYNCSEKGI